MYSDIKMLNAAASAVMGVNPGYDGDAMPIRDPKEAAAIVVEQALTQKLRAEIYPGLCLYARGSGCPTGGEAVGVIIMPDGGAPGMELKIQNMRDALGQNSIFIATPIGAVNAFTDQSESMILRLNAPEDERDLPFFANAWQKAAAAEHNRADIHVSGTIFQMPHGPIFGQIDANPIRINGNYEGWSDSARRVFNTVAPGAEIVRRRIACKYLAVRPHPVIKLDY